MGGCRCYFQGCKVSTARNPGMHFFHFPKAAKLLEEWIRYSGFKDYLKLPDSKQKNKVICGRHFKDTCFMNHKHNRLVPTAIPTLTRLSHEWALDYESDVTNPMLIKIYPPSAPHLIRPEGHPDPLCFNADDLNFSDEVTNMIIIKDPINTNEAEKNTPKRRKNNSITLETDELDDNLNRMKMRKVALDTDDREESTSKSTKFYSNVLKTDELDENLEHMETLKFALDTDDLESTPKRSKFYSNILNIDEIYDNLDQDYIVELSNEIQVQTISVDGKINCPDEGKEVAVSSSLQQTPKEENLVEIETLKKQLVLERSRYKCVEEEKNKRIKELELILARKLDELNEMYTKFNETEAKISALIRKEEEKNESFDKQQQTLNAQLSKYEALEQEQNEINKVNNERLTNKTIEITAIKAKLHKTEAEVIALNSQNYENNEKFNKIKQELIEMTKKYNKLKKEHEELQNQKQILEHVFLEQKETSKNLKKEESQSLSAQPQQLTKLQLFNGIKRYLSSTMTAILRMQLSSSSIERTWKPDEKRVALDLFCLGEDIYKYFTDEWLIRLPSLRDVQSWQLHIEPDDEDDL